MFKMNEIKEAVERWLVTGELNASILANDFTFSSPFWQQANRENFIDKFSDPTAYIEKSLSNIVKFDSFVYCISHDNRYFTLTFTYYTKNGCSVDEVVLCKIKDGLLQSMKTIYDLSQTKKAHNL